MASAGFNLFGMLPRSFFVLNGLGHNVLCIPHRKLTRPSERPLR